jgi:hypothetical protein
LGGKATAQNCEPTILRHYGICIKIPPRVTQGSICVSSHLFGFRGVGVESLPSYETALTIEELKWHWRNKKGNSTNPENHVFGDQTEPLAVNVNKDLQIKKNGSARDYTCFESDEILDLVEAAGLDLNKPNNSKHFFVEMIVTGGFVLNTVFVCAVPDGNGGFIQIGDPTDPRNPDTGYGGGCLFQDSIGQTITAPADAEFGVPFNYIQYEDCSDGEGPDECTPDFQVCPDGDPPEQDPLFQDGYRCLPS